MFRFIQMLTILFTGEGMRKGLIQRTRFNFRRNLVVATFLFLLSAFYSTNAAAQETLVGLTSNGGAEGGGTAFNINTNGSGFGVVKTFANWGKSPTGDLIVGKDGFYYGMTYEGGIYNDGTIFKVSTAGEITVVHNFYSLTDGANPYGALVLAPDGDFYGMTNAGGTNTYGTIFRLSAQGVFTVLRHFNYATDGANPFGSLVIGKDGHFYGVTRKGGSTGFGTIFRITLPGVFTVIKTFSADPKIDGNSCYGSLSLASDSNFYGINYSGGTFGNGTIFKVTAKGEYTVLKHMNALTDGYAYTNNLLEAPDGLLYGMSHYGGTNGQGTIYRISKSGDFKVLRHMNFKTDGSGPSGSLAMASPTEMIGMSKGGGANGHGTVFSITTAGTFKLLKSFNLTTDGAYPKGGLVKGTDGNFYGMTNEGGAGFYGTVFRISSKGIFSVIKPLSGGHTGTIPMESLVQGKDFAFYGTTVSGGTYNHGTIFKICNGVYSVIKSFNKNTDGGMPKGSLIQAADGNFYGTTTEGGLNNSGTVFRISSSGAYAVVYHFLSYRDGNNAQGTLTEGADGLLYGTCTSGGTNNGGTIFKVSNKGLFTLLKQLNTATDGSNPEGSLLKANDSVFYGMTTNGATILKITKSGVYTVLKKFVSTTDGNYPAGHLVRANDGNFYGIANSGGSAGGGTIFRINETGAFKVMKHLNATTDGSQAKGSLVLAGDGHLYGITSAGGTGKSGTIFRITTAGAYTVLKHLNIKTDGGTGFGSLVIQKPNPLVADTQTVAAIEDIVKPIVLTGSGATPLIFSIVTMPKNGTITGGSVANRTYTPAANFAGKDSFYFKVSFGCLSSAPAKVVINVAPVDNDAPVLDSTGIPSTTAGSVLGFQAKAKEYDQGQLISFSISAAPAGALIDSKTGIFKWPATKAGTYTMKLRVSDNGKPVLFDEELITLKVNPNSAPVLDSTGTKTVKISTLLSFKVTAKDIDSGQIMNYSLVTAPAGAVIDAKTGLFKWTPPASGIFKFSTKVTDNGLPALSDTELITVNVVTNLAPVLDSVRAKSVKAGSLLSFKVTAKDPDAGQKLSYALSGNATGAVINAATGAFSWTPDKAGAYRVTFTVSDNGTPLLSDAEIVTITVLPNLAPVMDSIKTKTGVAGTNISFKVTAKDPDAGQKLSYSLVGAPAGATINATTGIFNWIPAAAGTFSIRFRVSDNGIPVLIDEEIVKFTITAKGFSRANETSEKLYREGTEQPSVYPNPVQTTCIIDLKQPVKNVTARITGLAGSAIYQSRPSLAGETLVKLDMSQLKTGQYIVTLYDGNKQWVVKIVKL